MNWHMWGPYRMLNPQAVDDQSNTPTIRCAILAECEVDHAIEATNESATS